VGSIPTASTNLTGALRGASDPSPADASSH